MTHDQGSDLPEERVYAREPRFQGSAVIIGVGAVGGHVAEKLARLGFSPLYLVDQGILSAENVARHPLGAQHVGQPKSRALKERIRADAPWCTADAEDVNFLHLDEADQVELLTRVKLVIAATDSIECQRRINELCVQNQIPALYPGIWADETMRDGEVAALLRVIPEEGPPCYQCYVAWRRPVGDADARGGSVLDVGEFANAVVSAALGVLQPDHERSAALDPERTLTLFHGLTNISPGIVHLFSRNVRHLRVPSPREACPVCGGQESNPALPGRAVGLTDAIGRLVPEADIGTYLRRISRGSWLLSTLAVLLISLRVESATGLSPRTNMAADIWNLGVLIGGVCGAAWPRRTADRPAEFKALVSAVVTLALVLVTAVVWKVLPSDHGAPNSPIADSQSVTTSAAGVVSPTDQFAGTQGEESDSFGDAYMLTIGARVIGFTVHLSLSMSYDPALVDRKMPRLLSRSAHSCLEVNGDAYDGDTYAYREQPLAVSLKRPHDGLITGTMTFAAVLPGSYSFDYLCLGVSGDPLNIGGVTVRDNSDIVSGFEPGIATDSSGGNATTIFGIRSTDQGGVTMFFGAAGTVSGLSNTESTCLSTNDAQHITPSAVSITHSGSGNGQSYEVGVLTFDVPTWELTQSDILYDCSTGTNNSYVWIP